MAFEPFGHSLILRLVSALGLEPAETQKVVIVIDPDDVVKVYAVFCPQAEDLRRVCEVFEAEIIPVADVVVDDKANVTVTPKGS
jgi:hypothetical protein